MSLRTINFFDGYTSGTNPDITQVDVNSFVVFSDDASFESGYSLEAGSMYYNTTINQLKYYNGTEWKVCADESDLTDHASDATIHFVEGSINHDNILNNGSNTHGDIDDHIVNTAIHFGESSIDHTNITNIGTNSHADIDTHIGASTAHGVSGSVVGTSDAQVLTEKDIDGGTASNTSRITLPKASTTTLDGLTDKEATLAYDTDKSKLVYNDGSVWNELSIGGSKLETNVTVTVGSGGDYTNLNDAVKGVWDLYAPSYDKDGIRVTINMLAGFVMAEQIIVDGLNMGWMTITGADAETSVTHTALTTALEGSYPIFGVSNGGTLPVIDQLFRMSSGAGTNKHGVIAAGAGSSANVSSGAGFVDAGGIGLHARKRGEISAGGANVSNAGNTGIYATANSYIYANLLDASNAGTYGIYALSASAISADGANASGAGTYGIYAVNASTINANSANASGAGTTGIYASGSSTIEAAGADASGIGSRGFYANAGSTINAAGGDASDKTDRAILANNGSRINANSAIVRRQTSGPAGVSVLGGSIIESSGIDFTDTTVALRSPSSQSVTGAGIIFD